MTKAKIGVYVLGAVLSAGAALAMVSFLKDEPESLSQGNDGTGGAFLVKGQVQATGAAEDIAKQIGTVYVILKDGSGGPPYAVARLANSGSSSLSFELKPEHVMIPGRTPPGTPVLKVRFDADADASTENPGDVIGELSNFAMGQDDLLVQAELMTQSSE